MNRITKDMTMRQISALPEFGGYGALIALSEGPDADRTLEEIAARTCWNAESMAEGYERIREVQARQRVYYPLYEEAEAAETPELRERFMLHFAAEKKSPFAVICAGGGYEGVASPVEAFPTARHLNRLGLHAFTLNYRCNAGAIAPQPIDDLACCVRYILDHADELGVEKEGYAACGFSAGGHLVACFGTEAVGWKHYGLPAPAALFLCYPVISMGEDSHDSTRELFLGSANLGDRNMEKLYSPDQQVTPLYPPVFLWQCERDESVPIENSRRMAAALEKNKVPFVYETFDSAYHGWGAGDGTAAEGWPERAAGFWLSQRDRAGAGGKE